MKKIIIILLFFSNVAYAQLGARLEIGNALPYGTKTYSAEGHSESEYVFSDILLFYDFTLGIKHRLYYGFRCWAFRNDLLSSSPFRQIYTGGYKAQYGKAYVRLEHFCNHPVWSGENNKSWLNNKWGENLTTVSIGIEFK